MLILSENVLVDVFRVELVVCSVVSVVISSKGGRVLIVVNWAIVEVLSSVKGDVVAVFLETSENVVVE